MTSFTSVSVSTFPNKDRCGIFVVCSTTATWKWIPTNTCTKKSPCYYVSL